MKLLLTVGADNRNTGLVTVMLCVGGEGHVSCKIPIVGGGPRDQANRVFGLHSLLILFMALVSRFPYLKPIFKKSQIPYD